MSKTWHQMESEAVDYLLGVDADLRSTAGELFRMHETADLLLNRVYRDGAALAVLLAVPPGGDYGKAVLARELDRQMQAADYDQERRDAAIDVLADERYL